jgi:hypothetical protein
MMKGNVVLCQLQTIMLRIKATIYLVPQEIYTYWRIIAKISVLINEPKCIKMYHNSVFSFTLKKLNLGKLADSRIKLCNLYHNAAY